MKKSTRNILILSLLLVIILIIFIIPVGLYVKARKIHGEKSETPEKEVKKHQKIDVDPESSQSELNMHSEDSLYTSEDSLYISDESERKSDESEGDDVLMREIHKDEKMEDEGWMYRKLVGEEDSEHRVDGGLIRFSPKDDLSSDDSSNMSDDMISLEENVPRRQLGEKDVNIAQKPINTQTEALLDFMTNEKYNADEFLVYTAEEPTFKMKEMEKTRSYIGSRMDEFRKVLPDIESTIEADCGRLEVVKKELEHSQQMTKRNTEKLTDDKRHLMDLIYRQKTIRYQIKTVDKEVKLFIKILSDIERYREEIYSNIPKIKTSEVIRKRIKWILNKTREILKTQDQMTREILQKIHIIDLTIDDLETTLGHQSFNE